MFLAVALPMVAVASLSGCGGGGGDTATASEPLTRAQFIERASKICKIEDEEMTRRLAAGSRLGEKYLSGSKQELTQLVAEVILPLYDERIEELAALNPPAGDKAEVKRVIDHYEKTLEEAEANPRKLVLNNIFYKPNITASKYGIKDCTL